MFGLFKSQKQREQEAALDAYLDAIAKSLANAETEIRTLEMQVEPRLRRQAAIVIGNLLIHSERTAASVEELQRRAERMRAEGRVHHAIGTSLGSRLVACGVILLQLNGETWLKGSLAFAHLEGLIKGFVERLGVESWPVSYVYDGEFEQYRQQRIAEYEEEQRNL